MPGWLASFRINFISCQGTAALKWLGTAGSETKASGWLIKLSFRKTGQSCLANLAAAAEKRHHQLFAKLSPVIYFNTFSITPKIRRLADSPTVNGHSLAVNRIAFDFTHATWGRVSATNFTRSKFWNRFYYVRRLSERAELKRGRDESIEGIG